MNYNVIEGLSEKEIISYFDEIIEDNNKYFLSESGYYNYGRGYVYWDTHINSLGSMSCMPIYISGRNTDDYYIRRTFYCICVAAGWAAEDSNCYCD